MGNEGSSITELSVRFDVPPVSSTARRETLRNRALCAGTTKKQGHAHMERSVDFFTARRSKQRMK